MMYQRRVFWKPQIESQANYIRDSGRLIGATPSPTFGGVLGRMGIIALEILGTTRGGSSCCDRECRCASIQTVAHRPTEHPGRSVPTLCLWWPAEYSPRNPRVGRKRPSSQGSSVTSLRLGYKSPKTKIARSRSRRPHSYWT